MKHVAFSVALLLLAGCAKPTPNNVANVAGKAGNSTMSENVAENAAEPPRSILRPEVVEKEEAPKIQPIDMMVDFGASPLKLDDAGRKVIDTLLATPTAKAGGAITLFGHSDSRGSDGDNKVASRIRAELVRDYLVETGVAKDRITVVALGEGRPVAPNVKEDGSDDPEGRAKNRRVEIMVAAPLEASVPNDDDPAKP